MSSTGADANGVSKAFSTVSLRYLLVLYHRLIFKRCTVLEIALVTYNCSMTFTFSRGRCYKRCSVLNSACVFGGCLFTCSSF